MIRRTGLVAVVIGVFALTIGVASGHVKKTSSEVTISHMEVGGPDPLFGEVTSSKGRCESNRRINVHWLGAGDPDLPVYTTTSNADGDWSVSDDGFYTNPGEEFYAVARKKKLRVGDGHRHICRPATSPTLTIVEG